MRANKFPIDLVDCFVFQKRNSGCSTSRTKSPKIFIYRLKIQSQGGNNTFACCKIRVFAAEN